MGILSPSSQLVRAPILKKDQVNPAINLLVIKLSFFLYVSFIAYSFPCHLTF